MSVRLPLPPSLLLGAAVALAALATAACGGAPKHIDEITPVVAGSISGAWALNEDESDDPDQAAPEAGPGRGGAGARGGMPGRGGMPPGGGMPGGRGGMPGAGPGGGMGPRGGGRRPAGASNPEAAQVLRRMVSVAPRRLELALSDSAVVVTYPREDAWVLPFGKGVKRKEGEGVEVETKAEWKEGLLSVTRKVSGAGSVRETFYPTADRHRLTVSVELAMGDRGAVEFRRVYQPEGKQQGGPAR